MRAGRALLAAGVKSMPLSVYDPFSTYTANRVVLGTDGGTYRSNSYVPRGLGPAGVGDGSMADRLLLLSQRQGYALTANVTGGLLGDTYKVTTTADSGPGSYRAGLESPLAYWIVFDKTVFSPFTGGTINLTSTITPLPNKTVDMRGAKVQINNSSQHLIQGIGNPTNAATTFLRYPNGDANMIFTHGSFDTTSSNFNRDCFTITYGTDRVWFNHIRFTGGTDAAVDISQPDDGGVSKLYGTPSPVFTRVSFSWVMFGPMPTAANLLQQGTLTGGNNLPENGKTNLWGLGGDTYDKLFIDADHCLWYGGVQRQPKFWYGAHGHIRNSSVRYWGLVPGVVQTAAQQAGYAALGKSSVVASYGSVGTQVEQGAKVLIENTTYRPYLAGDAHVLDPSWPMLYPDTDAILHDNTAALRTSNVRLSGGATRDSDYQAGLVEDRPYTYDLTPLNDVDTDLDAGVGPVDLWTRIG